MFEVSCAIGVVVGLWFLFDWTLSSPHCFLDGLSWFKSFRKVNPHDHPKPPTWEEFTKDPEPEPTPKDISEPVIKVLDLMKTEPGRFCVRSETHDKGRVDIYVITDRSSGVSVRPAQYHDYRGRARRHSVSDTWLTSDEVIALYQAAAEIHHSRTEAWQKVRNKAQRDWFKQQLNKGSN